MVSGFIAGASQSYLGFLDQVQQVFDVVSQQILALPHLIQSSGRNSGSHLNAV